MNESLNYEFHWWFFHLKSYKDFFVYGHSFRHKYDPSQEEQIDNLVVVDSAEIENSGEKVKSNSYEYGMSSSSNKNI